MLWDREWRSSPLVPAYIKWGSFSWDLPPLRTSPKTSPSSSPGPPWFRCWSMDTGVLLIEDKAAEGSHFGNQACSLNAFCVPEEIFGGLIEGDSSELNVHIPELPFLHHVFPHQADLNIYLSVLLCRWCLSAGAYRLLRAIWSGGFSCALPQPCSFGYRLLSPSSPSTNCSSDRRSTQSSPCTSASLPSATPVSLDGHVRWPGCDQASGEWAFCSRMDRRSLRCRRFLFPSWMRRWVLFGES